MISWALRNAIFFQLLIGKVAPKESNKNSIRGEYGRDRALRTASTTDRNTFEESTAMIFQQSTTTTETMGFSTEFSDFFGEAVDPVTVYLLLLFDVTTAEHISWKIRESSSRDLLASATDGTYTSQSDFTELVRLVPGKTYEIEVVDDSLASIRDRMRGTYTNFAIVVSEPPQEIAKLRIASGTVESAVFTVPSATRNITLPQEDSPDVTVGDDLVSVNSSTAPFESPSSSPTQEAVSSSPSIPSTNPVESSSDSNSPTMTPSSIPSPFPSMIPVESPSDSISSSPSLTPSTSPVQPLDSISPTTANSFELSSRSPFSQAPVFVPFDSCAAKGGTCSKNSDCCSDRCSPEKKCYPSGVSGRQRIAPNGRGGSAGELSRRGRDRGGRDRGGRDRGGEN